MNPRLRQGLIGLGVATLATLGLKGLIGESTALRPRPITWEDLAYSQNPEHLIGCGPVPRQISPDSNNAIEVFQSQYAITRGDSERPLLETWHLSPCTALVLDDRASRLGALAHFDAGRLYGETLDEIAEQLRLLGVHQDTLTARLYGAHAPGGAHTLAPIVTWLRAHQIPITENDTQPCELNGIKDRRISIIYDSRTGSVSDYTEGPPETNYRVDLEVLPHRKLHRHPQSLSSD